MKWDRDYTSSDVEDRRGEAGPIVGGGSDGGGVPVGLLFWVLSRFGWKGWLLGLVIVGVAYCGLPYLQDGDRAPRNHVAHHPAPATSVSAQEAELTHFVEFVFDDVQKSWEKRIPSYQHAKLVLFRGSVASACGATSAAVGPFYCPRDAKVYIDLSFYDELRTELGAPGDFAQAYVIAHELGHHVQNLRPVRSRRLGADRAAGRLPRGRVGQGCERARRGRGRRHRRGAQRRAADRRRHAAAQGDRRRAAGDVHARDVGAAIGIVQRGLSRRRGCMRRDQPR